MARYPKDKAGYFYTVIEQKRAVGEPRHRKFIRAKTVARLKEKIAAFLVEQDEGLAAPKSDAPYTVLTWVWEWLRGVELRGKVRASTLKRYKSAIKVHISPILGKVVLRELTLAHVQAFLDRLIEKGGKGGKPLAPQTVKNTWIPLKQALDSARKRGLTRIITTDVELPAAIEPDLYQITPDEMRRFLTSVAGDRFEFAVLARCPGLS